MTCKERASLDNLEHPVKGCPMTYGYLGKPTYCHKASILGPTVCEVCWTREIPEDGSEEE